MRVVIAVVAVFLASCTSGPVPPPPYPLMVRPIPSATPIMGAPQRALWTDRWPDFARSLDALLREYEGKHGPLTEQERKCIWARAAAVMSWRELDVVYAWIAGSPPIDGSTGRLFEADAEQVETLESSLEYWERMERAYCGTGGGESPAVGRLLDIAERSRLYREYDGQAILLRWRPEMRPRLRRPAPACGCRVGT